MADAPTPTQPGTPSPLNNLVASMSRPELLILAGGAIIVLTDVIFLFISGYGFSHVITAGGAVAALLVLFRANLPSSVSAVYQAALFLAGVTVAVMGARNVILDLLTILRPPMGATPAFVLGFAAILVATGLVAYGTFLLWRDRTV